MAKRKPRTGEKRVTRQPFSIDRLPVSVQEKLVQLRNRDGKTWEQIEELSAEPAGDGLLGFVNWEDLPTPVLELFPHMRIPKSNLHRWYDVYFEQKRADVLARAAQAREIAEAFAASAVDGGDEAVVNAARDTIMSMLAEDSSVKGRSGSARALVALAEVMQAARANDIKERKVEVEERRIAQLEKDAEARRRKMDEETAKTAKKAAKGEVTPEDIDRLRERVFGLPPLVKAG